MLASRTPSFINLMQITPPGSNPRKDPTGGGQKPSKRLTRKKQLPLVTKHLHIAPKPKLSAINAKRLLFVKQVLNKFLQTNYDGDMMSFQIDFYDVQSGLRELLDAMNPQALKQMVHHHAEPGLLKDFLTHTLAKSSFSPSLDPILAVSKASKDWILDYLDKDIQKHYDALALQKDFYEAFHNATKVLGLIAEKYREDKSILAERGFSFCEIRPGLKKALIDLVRPLFPTLESDPKLKQAFESFSEQSIKKEKFKIHCTEDYEMHHYFMQDLAQPFDENKLSRPKAALLGKLVLMSKKPEEIAPHAEMMLNLGVM